MSQIRKIESGNIIWEVRTMGSGPEILFAFHGFNRSMADFEPFSAHLSGKFTIVAVALFSHGSCYRGNEPGSAFSKAELTEAFCALFNAFKSNRYSVLGHSFGGRLALNMSEYCSDRIASLYLLAPDALRYHPGYRFMTGTIFGRLLMGRFRENPARVISVIRLLRFAGFYSEKSASFFIHQIKHPIVRQKVFECWMAHRKTIPNLNTIADKINGNHIRTVLFFGRNDTIIPVKQGRSFCRKIGKPDALNILDCGHRVHEKHAEICSVIR